MNVHIQQEQINCPCSQYTTRATCKDLNETNTCDDGDDLDDLGLVDTFPIFTSNLTFGNCSLAEKVSRLQEFKVRAPLFLPRRRFLLLRVNISPSDAIY